MITVLLMTLLSDTTSLINYDNKQEDVPKFDDHVPDSYTVQQGATAYLGCRIINHNNM